eukprot:Gb_38165 [translate_table: standard]
MVLSEQASSLKTRLASDESKEGWTVVARSFEGEPGDVAMVEQSGCLSRLASIASASEGVRGVVRDKSSRIGHSHVLVRVVQGPLPHSGEDSQLQEKKKCPPSREGSQIATAERGVCICSEDNVPHLSLQGDRKKESTKKQLLCLYPDSLRTVQIWNLY